MNDDNPYSSPEPIASGREPVVGVTANLGLIGMIGSLAILAVQVLLWCLVFVAVAGIVYRLCVPYYYHHVKGFVVVLNPGYYYKFAVRPGVLALLIGAVAWGLGRLRRLIQRRLTRHGT